MDSRQTKELRIYRFFSHRNWPKSYIGKIMLVAFVGTHIPLLAILVHFLLSSAQSTPATVYVLWLALAATLAGTGVTLLALNNLLQPIRVTCFALRQYLSIRETPTLPTQFTDEAGLLMADTQHVLVKLDTVILQLSYYDDLTGLPNRLLFQDQLVQAMAAALRQEKSVAVLLLDVSGLKHINEIYGRETGDLILQALADRIGKQIREMDVFARVGDDEFALLQTDVTDQVSVEVQAQRLLEIITSQAFPLGGREIHVQATIGISIFPHHHNKPEELLGNAESARNQAREQNASSSFCFYDVGMNARLRRRLELEAGLRIALERNDLELHYQPQISRHDSTIIGMEALTRWNHPEHGPISPTEFIPIAEKSDLIFQLGEWVLRTACRQNKAWQDAGFPPLRMAVNLSARQFQQPNLVGRVASILEETGMDVRWLEMEVTESVAMDNTGLAIAALHGLRDLGVTLSLDDFGTGYSSLSQLGRLPINTLKIDRSFVHDVMENAENASITHAIISLAQSLQLEVIAEGIETEAQFEHLKSRGCGQFQGYFFSRPVPAETIETLMRFQGETDSTFQLAVSV